MKRIGKKTPQKYCLRNTLYSSRADRAYGGCPPACRPSLQGFNAEVATGCFPVLLFCISFSTLRPVRRTRIYCPRAGIFLGVKLVSAPLTGASAISPSARPRKANFRQSAYWGAIHGCISALARGYSHGVTSLQNLDGLLDSLFFFVSSNYRNYLVVWHRLKAELVSQGPLEAYDQPKVRTSFWKVAMNLVGYVDPARGGDILVPAVGSGLTEFGQHISVPCSSILDWASTA